MAKKEFWNSPDFWIPAFVSLLIGGFAALVFGGLIWGGIVWGNRQFSFTSKDFLLRSASGEKIDQREAYATDNIYTVISGQFLFEQNKKGVKLESTIQEIEKTDREFSNFGHGGDRSRPRIEEYKKFLRDNYHTPEPILYLADVDRWKDFATEDNVRELKEVLAGKPYKSNPPDYYSGFRPFLLFWIFLVQFVAYAIAFGMFILDNYKYIRYLPKANIGMPGFFTFALFSPGALPIIIVQLIMIAGHLISNAKIEIEKKESEKKLRGPVDLNPEDSGQSLLAKLQQRIER